MPPPNPEEEPRAAAGLSAPRRLPRMLLVFGLLLAACRSPLADLRPAKGERLALELPPVVVEDHSRTLKRIRDVAVNEPNSAEARKAALEAHGAYLDAAFRRRAAEKGLALDPAAPYRLELRVTTLGEVRTKYIVYGILSGVAWGVGTGLLTHNVKLAVGLGGYELVEESLFWIAGSSLFGRFSAPVVLEAELQEKGRPKPLWSETYLALWGGARLKAYPEADRKRREIQLHASLDRVLDKVFEDLAQVPDLAKGPQQEPGSGAPQPDPGGVRPEAEQEPRAAEPQKDRPAVHEGPATRSPGGVTPGARTGTTACNSSTA